MWPLDAYRYLELPATRRQNERERMSARMYQYKYDCICRIVSILYAGAANRSYRFDKILRLVLQQCSY